MWFCIQTRAGGGVLRVFINLGRDAALFMDTFGALKKEILRYLPRIEELAFAQRDTYHVAANWKFWSIPSANVIKVPRRRARRAQERSSAKSEM